MRLLFFHRSATPQGGGMNRYVADVARRLRQAGHEVALVHARKPAAQFEGTGYIYDHLDYRLPPDEKAAVRLEAILEDFSPDVIQLHGVGNTLLDEWLAGRCPTVRFVHNHDFYCSGRLMTWARPHRPCQRLHGGGCLALHWLRGCGSWNPLLNLLRHRQVTAGLSSLRSLPALQVSSRVLRRHLIANGVDAARITLLPPYAPPPPANRGERPRPPQRTILHVGGLLNHKGVWLLVRMARLLPRDVQLVFAGGGREQEMLEHHVRRRGLGERIRIMGEPTARQWADLYRQADLVVLPALWNEPLGLDGLYAMAHGKPAVAFDIEGIGEWLEHDVTGVRVPFGDRRAFQSAVLDLLHDAARLERLGRQARAAWENRYQPHHHIAALVACYRGMLPATAAS